MSKVEYPTLEELDWWIQYIKDESKNTFLIKYLPITNMNWSKKVMDVIILAQLSEKYKPQTVHHQAAIIFYKIIKAHNHIDSNKRSAIIVTYLFCILNNYALIGSDNIRKMAIKIAKSKGRNNYEKWIIKTSNFLSTNTVYLN